MTSDGASAADPQMLLLQMLDPANRADPYPLFAQIRELGPLLMPESNMTVFSSFADCDEVLRHPDSCSDSMKSSVVQRHLAAGATPPRGNTPGFLFLDPPDHTRLRKLAQQAFAPRVVRALEPDIAAMVDGLLDAMAAAGSADLISDLAYPLPVAVICRLLGVPVEDESQFSSAAALVAQALDPIMSITGAPDPEADARLEAGAWLREYLGELVERRRADPQQDLISALIAAEEDGDQLTADEIVATCNLLLIAGHETTVNLIGGGVLELLRHPDQMDRLRRDPSLVRTAVEELLRYTSPVFLATERYAREDLELGGVAIPRGGLVFGALGSANRDGAAFADPDRLDVARAENKHLGFGEGIHYCLGAPLARLEARVAIETLLRRSPDLHLAVPAESLRWRRSLILRGLDSLPVRF